MLNSENIIKYIDLFGTRCTFYSEKMPKYYTVTGGLFSILSILGCILIFLLLSLDDIKRKYPITTISYIPSEGYRKIKFGKEKIWIPWRIIDYNNHKFVNHTGILFPIIYYYSGKKDYKTKNFNLTTKILNYTLCNETSMANEDNLFLITVPLNELYCIEMEDLEIGGSWITEFINYIEFDLYYCEDGINYDEVNPKCSSFNKIKNFTGENNSLEIALYYPVVQFQPTNKINPVIVIYREYFYHISRYSNKIERLFLQENVLTDDLGWILKDEYNHSYWGLNSLNGDSYLSGSENDLMNEGSNSRAYSFNIYLEPGIIHYKRYYKKLDRIFSDFFPIAYIIFIIMKNISKLFKKVESNKKMIELLFENLKEKPNIFEENLQKMRIKNSIHKIRRFSFNSLNNKKIFDKNIRSNHKLSNDFNHINNKLNIRYSSSSMIKKDFLLNNDSNSNKQRKSSKFLRRHKKLMLNKNASNQNLLVKDNIKESKFKGGNSYLKLKNNNEKINNETGNQSLKQNKIFIKQGLFPYKYYLCSVFIRNLDATKKNYFISSRFAKVYTFFCQLIDITTYLCLLREFNALKKIFNEDKVNLIEENKKININSNSFIRDISDCIGEQKFYILAQGIK